MLNLIKIELKKIFHKKSFYIVSIIFICYCFLVSFLYKSLNNNDLNNHLLKIEVEKIQEANANLEETNPEYQKNLNLLKLNDLRTKYNSNNAKYLLDRYIYPKLGTKNAELISNLLNEIENENWEYFTEYEITEIQNKLATAKEESVKESLKIELKLNKYRLNNHVNYDYENYLHNSIDFIENNIYEYKNLKNIKNLSESETSRLKYLDKEMLYHEYILKNKVDLNNSSSLHTLIMSFAVEFGLFILIYVVLISGSIMSEEYSRGTIKSLLTKPHTRTSILLSKYLTILILIPFIIIGMFLINLVIGSFILNPTSLKIPVVLYDSLKNILITENIFIYSFKCLLSILPMYFIIATFAFFISSTVGSTSSAITLSFGLYLIGNIVNEFYLKLNLPFLKYFVSLHWNFSYLVDLTRNPYSFNISTSLITLGIYLSVILCLTFVIFSKKDVKNI